VPGQVGGGPQRRRGREHRRPRLPPVGRQFYTRVVASEPALLSGEACELAGGLVRGDIGDGKVACASGENEIGRVRTGIEGGVCCERIVLTPDQCESAGGFIRTDIGDGKVACEAGEIDLGRVAFGREGGVCCQ
jgi:hypothetical protein